MNDSGVEIAGMVPLRGGTFEMGSNHHYPEEAPAFTTQVRPFAMDVGTVTNAEFAAFVQATGYVTEVERPLDPTLAPDLPPEAYLPGGLVFTKTDGPVPLHDFRQWWRFVPGAYWAAPKALVQPCRGGGITLWCRSPTLMQRPMHIGQAKRCRRKRNGSLRPDPGWQLPGLGGTN